MDEVRDLIGGGFSEKKNLNQKPNTPIQNPEFLRDLVKNHAHESQKNPTQTIRFLSNALQVRQGKTVGNNKLVHEVQALGSARLST